MEIDRLSFSRIIGGVVLTLSTVYSLMVAIATMQMLADFISRESIPSSTLLIFSFEGWEAIVLGSMLALVSASLAFSQYVLITQKEEKRMNRCLK